MLEFIADTQTRKERELVDHVVCDPVYVENVFPVVNVGHASDHFHHSFVLEFEALFHGNVHSVVVRQTLAVEVAQQNTYIR